MKLDVTGIRAATSGMVTGFLPTQHYSNYYLYVEHEGGKNVTLIDVTKAAQPVVLSDVAYSSNGAAGGESLVAVAGTAAILTEQPGATTPAPAAQTVRIMDFSDPLHPKIAREFSGVTTMSRDERRGLIFLANPEGIWILHQSFAEDPEVEKDYARRILYDH
ncbi:MAG TPA: hypothetical protein VH639_24840 [Bryobacteraceae bacterium]|jgi:hypothetical protein